MMTQRYGGRYREDVNGPEIWWKVRELWTVQSCGGWYLEVVNGAEMWWKVLRSCGTEDVLEMYRDVVGTEMWLMVHRSCGWF